MSPVWEKIKVDYEVNGASVEDIAEDLGVDAGSVKSILCQCSEKFGESVREEREDITDSELAEFFEAYKHLGRYAEEESIRAKVLWNLINEKKGRNDIRDLGKQTGGGSGNNIFIFNQVLKDKRRARLEKRVLEVEEVVANG